MGLFDFLWGKKSKPPAQAASNEPAISDRKADDGLSLHYMLAHYALRQFALSDPESYLAIMASPRARDFLQSVINDIGKKVSLQPTFSAEDLFVHPICVGQYPCAIVEFPPPQKMTEVYFTACLVMMDVREERTSEEPPPVRYVTLEKGYSGDGSPRTVLCEWTESTHHNFGNGPPPTLLEFEASLAKFAQERRS